MEIFLKAKHWQIFTVLIGIPFIVQVTIFTLMISHREYDMTAFILPIMTFFFIIIFFGWFWSIGTVLNNKLPDNVRINITLFKIFVLVPVVYLLGISLYMLTLATGLTEGGRPTEFIVIDIIDKVLPIHFLSMVCIFYIMWICAKTINSIENQRPVKFSDFAGDFFLIWFFPIGIWIIQPRLNKLVENNKAHTANIGS